MGNMVSLRWLCAALAAACSAPALAEDTPMPELAGFWQHGVPDFIYKDPPSGAGPIKRMGVPDSYGVNDHYQGDYTNPMLKPWAAEALKKAAERDIAGLPEATPQATCRPGGVPGALLYLRPVQFVQQKDRVTILYQFDHQSRTVWMDRPHAKDIKPSWYGESVGHYEGDTLVVDTAGMNDKGWVDHLGTPHTDQMHVVERYHVTNNGKMLEVNFTVEDPGTFNWPWSAVLRYGRAAPDVQQIDEEVCAENNYFHSMSPPTAEFDPIGGETFPNKD
jgi:hypothetical protein